MKPLSRREREVVILTLFGLSDKEIGRRLSLSWRTVEQYGKRIRAKYGIKNRWKLIGDIYRNPR